MANSKRIPSDPEKKARSWIGIFSILMVLFVTLMMLLEAMTGIAPVQTNGPAVSSNGIQPNPTLNVNVTWSDFKSTWSELEYNNSTALTNLPAEPSVITPNPVSINPADIQAPAMHKAIGGKYYNNTALLGVDEGTAPGAISKAGDIGQTVYYQANGTANGGYYQGEEITYPVTVLPSNNPQYDYITVSGTFSGPAITGMEMEVGITNNTTNHYAPMYNGYVQLFPNGHIQGYYMSINMKQANETIGNGLGIVLEAFLPGATTTPENITLNGVAITTFPMILGANSTGQQVFKAIGDAHLSQFDPTVPMNITNGGYQVAVSQPLQNLTISQASISSGSYIEQVTYQGIESLPTAPDLSYGPANLTENFAIPTSQTQVLDINGVSYLSTIANKNGTVELLTSVNPNSQTQFLQIVDYTQSQWTSISSPPGIFTIQGIEYYWEEFIIAILAVVGIGAGAASKHASSLRKVK